MMIIFLFFYFFGARARVQEAVCLEWLARRRLAVPGGILSTSCLKCLNC
jgi:hypothetical protein